MKTKFSTNVRRRRVIKKVKHYVLESFGFMSGQRPDMTGTLFMGLLEKIKKKRQVLS